MKLAFNPGVNSVVVSGTEISPQSWSTVDENDRKVQKAVDSGKIVFVDAPDSSRVHVAAAAKPLLDEIDAVAPKLHPASETSQDAEVRNTDSKTVQRGSAKKTSKE